MAVRNFYWTDQKLDTVSASHHVFESIAVIIGHRGGVVHAGFTEMFYARGHQEQLPFAVDVHLSVLTGHQDKLFPWKRHPLHNPQNLHVHFFFQVEVFPLIDHFIVIFVNGVIQVSYTPCSISRTLELVNLAFIFGYEV